MNLADIARILSLARDQIRHADYVIVGSLSIVGLLQDSRRVPERMLMSNDIDFYPTNDPDRGFDLTQALGEGSLFAREHGFYLDPVSPRLPTLPDGWEQRLVAVDLDNGIVIRCLDPHDAAISKYARGEPRDIEWIRSGLSAGILSMPMLTHLFAKTRFLDEDEGNAARQRLTSDEAWLPKPSMAKGRRRNTPGS
jgi:hypothetical protein